ncbi:MAG: AI-2E family transporter [Clostridia bacterium]|nr:AI-2E family transporter [Clostridia bacterium]
MKKTETKTIVKIATAVFVVFLAINYWPNISGIIRKILSAAMPLLIGCVIAYPLNILMSFYERHFFVKSKKRFFTKARTPLCLLLAVLTLITIIALVIALIVPQLVNCSRLLINEVPGAVENLFNRIKETKILSTDIMDKLASVNWQSKIQEITGKLFSGISNLASIVITTVTSLVSGIATAFVAIIFGIYLLLGKYRLMSQCKRIMRCFISEEKCAKIKHVLEVVDNSFRHFIVGQCAEAVILGILCAIGMLILRLPYAPMIGAVVAFTALIPIVGAFIGGIVGVLLIAMESPMQALIFLIFLIVLQQVEGNLIYPRVVGSSIGLPGIWVLAAVTVGGGVFGIFGMLLAVPLAASCYSLLREHISIKSKNN